MSVAYGSCYSDPFLIDQLCTIVIAGMVVVTGEHVVRGHVRWIALAHFFEHADGIFVFFSFREFQPDRIAGKAIRWVERKQFLKFI